MKNLLLCAACFILCCVLVAVISEISFFQIIVVSELFLVCAGGLILSLPSLITQNVMHGILPQKTVKANKKEGKSYFLEMIAPQLSTIGENMLAAGVLATLLFVLSVITNPGKLQNKTEIARDIFFPIVYSCRPAVYGFLLKFLFSLLAKNVKKQTNDLAFFVPKESVNQKMTNTSALMQLFSRRECEVALLVMENCTNAEIAEELYISVATVKRHLSNMFEKTGISSRRKLAEKLSEGPEQTER